MNEETAQEILEALKAMVFMGRLGEVPTQVTLERYESLIAKAEVQ